jgi:hypothetical protein
MTQLWEMTNRDVAHNHNKLNHEKKNKMKLKLAAIILTLAATTSLVCGQQSQSANPSGTGGIVGTWQVLRHGADCATGARLNPDFHVLMTFNQGGTLNAFGRSPGGGPFDTPECGNWVKTGDRTYRLRDVSYGYDENGAFAGRAELTAMVRLDSDADSLTANTTIDVFDANGNFLFSFCGKWSGERFQ